MIAITFHLRVNLRPDCFAAAKVERREVKVDTQEKVLREEMLPSDEIALPGAETPDFYFWHSCCHSIKTLGGGHTICDGAGFHDFTQHNTSSHKQLH